MNNSYIALGVSLCAGGWVSFSSADEPLVKLEVSQGNVVQAAHIYYNIATGERVVTQLDGVQESSASSRAVWSSSVSNQCAASGYTTEYFFGVSQGTSCIRSNSCFLNISVLDYGDIAVDTVVDSVRIDWVSAHEDFDDDGDGVGDGVEGLAGVWTWWDADNGRQVDRSTRRALISFRLFDLPGNILGEGNLTRYSVDVDLVGMFTGTSLSFEIGDSDGDPQGAAFHHAHIANMDNNNDGMPDSDLDGDGLFDWSWTVRFIQPGSDSDGDGVPDGDILDRDTIGIGFGAPQGRAVDLGDGVWVWEIDTSGIDAGMGEEDRFAIYSPPGINGDILYEGGFWFGGLNCDPDQQFGYTPSAMFEHQLFGPGGGVCAADLNSDGALNFFDVSLFIVDYLGGGDYNGDGGTSFFDISEFLADFGNGCP